MIAVVVAHNGHAAVEVRRVVELVLELEPVELHDARRGRGDAVHARQHRRLVVLAPAGSGQAVVQVLRPSSVTQISAGCPPWALIQSFDHVQPVLVVLHHAVGAQCSPGTRSGM